MARDLIHFVPDRLNAEPVAYRGFTTPELAAATGLSLLAGLVIGIVPGLVWTWVIIPTCALFMPFVTILLGGRLLVRLKRGRPDNWLWQMAHWRLAQAGLGKRRTVIPPDTAGLARHDARGKPLTVSQYQQIWAHPPSFAAFLPWVDWLDGDRCLLLEDGHSVSAVYELTPFTTEGRKEARLAEIRDQVEDALQNSFDGLEETPWVIQFFCQDERDPQAWIAHIRDYIRPAARDTPFTGAWLEQMTRHLTVVARDGGLFEDTLVTGTAWQGRRRRVRMVVGRLTGASESTRRTPAQMLNQTCQRFTAALAGAGATAATICRQ